MHLHALLLLWEVALGPAACKPPVPFAVIKADNSPKRPETHPNESFFLHPESGHLLVVTPVDESPQLPPREYWSLVELSRFTVPSVRTVVFPLEGSTRLRYEYTFSNGHDARQKAGNWLLQDMEFDLADMKAPDGWKATHPPAMWRAHPAADRMKRQAIEARSAGFWPSRATDGLAPGQTQSGFSIISSLRPGPVLVWVKGFVTKGGLEFETSQEVVERLILLQRSCYNYQRTLAFAPRYDDTTDIHTIAQDFHIALQFQLESGVFRQDEPFSVEAEAVLGRLPSPTGLGHLRSLAKSPAEIDFTSALSIALARVGKFR